MALFKPIPQEKRDAIKAKREERMGRVKDRRDERTESKVFSRQPPHDSTYQDDPTENSVSRSEGDSSFIDSYVVTYRGGLRDLPKAKIGKIKLAILGDRFRLTADNNVARKFSTDIEIPYSSVRGVDVVDRNVSTFEGIAGGLNSRQLNQKNNIHFSYIGPEGPTLLRVEMLTGVSVMGQAKKCREFEDRLSAHGIRGRFLGTESHASTGDSATSIADELAKLAQMHASGTLTDDEFAAAKARLLG